MILARELNEEIHPEGRPVANGYISSYFGEREDPFTGEEAFHKGVDFAGAAGSSVVAVAAGVVTWAGERSGYGKLVEINHGNGYVTRYAHNETHAGAVGRDRQARRADRAHGLDRPLDRPARAFRSAAQRPPGRSADLRRALTPPTASTEPLNSPAPANRLARARRLLRTIRRFAAPADSS